MAKHSNNKQILNKTNIVTKIILIVFLIAFIYSVVQIVLWIKSNIAINTQYEKIIEEAIIQEENESGEIDFEALKEINPDVVAWIKIPDTTINYPILQGENNSYYLKKDIYGSYNSGGSIFMDSENSSSFTDYNTVIFGHNLLLGNMFSDLEKILNNELGTDIIIYIYLPNEEKQYRVFSSYLSEPTMDAINTNVTDIKTFISERIELSKIDFNLIPNAEDNIITLSTCNSNGKKRIIVHAVEVASKKYSI